jgi:flagellar hook-basal body complex protein FliE
MSGFNFEVMNRIGGTRIESPFGERIQQTNTEVSTNETDSGSAKTFGEALEGMLKDVNQSQLDANAAAQDIAAGRNKDIHSAVLSMEKAEIQFRLLAQVRNKVIEAYREIMRMQV